MFTARISVVLVDDRRWFIQGELSSRWKLEGTRLMPLEAAIAIAYVGATMGVIGGGIALFNARKTVLWKRAELANSYLRELSSNDELVFACRSLDWNGGILVVPDKLRPLLLGDKKTIAHDPTVLNTALRPGLLISDLEADERIQIYRTALDALLSWLSNLASGLERKLFTAKDLDEVGYWVHHIHNHGELLSFIEAFGYRANMEQLRRAFSYKAESYRDGRGPESLPQTITRGGFGSAGHGRSAGG